MDILNVFEIENLTGDLRKLRKALLEPINTFEDEVVNELVNELACSHYFTELYNTFVMDGIEEVGTYVTFLVFAHDDVNKADVLVTDIERDDVPQVKIAELNDNQIGYGY